MARHMHYIVASFGPSNTGSEIEIGMQTVVGDKKVEKVVALPVSSKGNRVVQKQLWLQGLERSRKRY